MREFGHIEKTLMLYIEKRKKKKKGIIYALKVCVKHIMNRKNNFTYKNLFFIKYVFNLFFYL